MPMEKTFDAASAEARLYQMWEEAGAFAAGAGAEDGAETFSIMIPPPNVTGSLHMGHAFNNTLQDILVRWHRMRGFDTLWQPGTDHAGIATQMVTEREMAANGEKSRTEMGREDFEKRVWQQKIKSRGTIIGQLKRLGASCDWSREAFTMSGAPNAPEGEDGNFHDAVIKVFVEMYEKGLIYRGKRLVNWDPHFETAISDLEVENIEVDGHMWHFQYPLQDGETYEYVEKDEDGNVLFTETRDYISIATTRPETMLGDGAVAVHPSDERYAPIVGKLCEIPVGPKEHRRMIPIITDEYPDPDFGSGAVKITGAHDFNDYEVAKRGRIPMYRLMDTKAAMRSDGAPYAEAAEIAGAVARDERDLSVAEADMVNLVPDALRGLDRFEARKQVIEQITSEGLAVMVPATDPRLGKGAASAGKAATGEAPTDASEGGEPRTDADQLVPLVEPKKVMQPFGDRSKVVIEPMLTDQWFVDTDKIVGPAIDAVRSGEVTILPERDRNVYFHWLENIEPWCISRQLWWGHRIPVWYAMNPEAVPLYEEFQKVIWSNENLGRRNEENEQIYAQLDAIDARLRRLPDVKICAANEEEAERVASSLFPEGVTASTSVEATAQSMTSDRGYVERPSSFRMDPAGKIYEVKLVQDPDVLDTWFSSGLWPIGTLGWPEDTEALEKYFPTSTLITGFDIIFFWVARMMMMQYAVMGERPFDTVYVHALVRDEKGKKMSKSLGNVLDPLELIDDYGADAVRFTLTAMAAMGRDLKLSTSRIAGYRNFTTKLWNAVRFAEMNEVFENRGQGLPDAPKETVNRWIIGETAKVREEVDAALEAFRFNDAANALYAYVWGKVCDWYVEFSKPLLMDGTDAQKTETQATMAWVLDQCVTLLHPIMPFITEELWSLMAERDGPLVLADWPTYDTALVDPEAEAEMSWAIAMIDGVRSARAQMNVPAGLQVPVIRLESSDAARTAWDRNEAMIKRLARIDGLTDAEAAPKGSLAVSTPGASFALPLADIIDVDKEKARLGKSLEKLGKELGGLRGRLKNPKFVESAPEEVVQEAKANLAAREEEEAQLNAALERLAEIG